MLSYLAARADQGIQSDPSYSVRINGALKRTRQLHLWFCCCTALSGDLGQSVTVFLCPVLFCIVFWSHGLFASVCSSDHVRSTSQQDRTVDSTIIVPNVYMATTERVSSLPPRGMCKVVLCYDITNYQSFQHLEASQHHLIAVLKGQRGRLLEMLVHARICQLNTL